VNSGADANASINVNSNANANSNAHAHAGANVNSGANLYYFTTKGEKNYCDIEYTRGCFIVFGKETAGLPNEILGANPDRCFRIPMQAGIRSLNLSNSVAVVAYEVLRQNGFKGLK
jgi:tRNA (cytidine/uridine-2'-O-)-methyltransferase